MSEGIGGSMGGASGAPGNGMGNSSYGGERAGTAASVEIGKPTQGAIYEAESTPRSMSEKPNIPNTDSGPKPANQLLERVQTDGIDKGFESLAKGNFSEQPESEQEKPLQTDTSYAKKDQNKEPEKEISDEPDSSDKPQQEKVVPKEKTLAEIVRKISELHKKNMRLEQKQADMQQRLMNEKLASTAEAKVVHFDIARVTYERMRNEQTIQILMADLTERTTLAA